MALQRRGYYDAEARKQRINPSSVYNLGDQARSRPQLDNNPRGYVFTGSTNGPPLRTRVTEFTAVVQDVGDNPTSTAAEPNKKTTTRDEPHRADGAGDRSRSPNMKPVKKEEYFVTKLQDEAIRAISRAQLLGSGGGGGVVDHLGKPQLRYDDEVDVRRRRQGAISQDSHARDRNAVVVPPSGDQNHSRGGGRDNISPNSGAGSSTSESVDGGRWRGSSLAANDDDLNDPKEVKELVRRLGNWRRSPKKGNRQDGYGGGNRGRYQNNAYKPEDYGGYYNNGSSSTSYGGRSSKPRGQQNMNGGNEHGFYGTDPERASANGVEYGYGSGGGGYRDISSNSRTAMKPANSTPALITSEEAAAKYKGAFIP